MASITDYADAAVSIKGRNPGCGWPLAVIKAIESKGVFNKSDINRLKPDVLAELGRRGNSVKTSRKARARPYGGRYAVHR